MIISGFVYLFMIYSGQAVTRHGPKHSAFSGGPQLKNVEDPCCRGGSKMANQTTLNYAKLYVLSVTHISLVCGLGLGIVI